MKVEDLIGLKVVDVAHGSTVGEVKGALIDQDGKRIAALELGGGTFSRPSYIPYEDIQSLEHDVVTIPSAESVVDMGSFRSVGLTDHITGRKVVTEDGKDLGTVQSYSIDPKTGEITSITFAVDKTALGGLWKSVGDNYDLPGSFVKTLGENIVVDSSAPDVVGLRRAA